MTEQASRSVVREYPQAAAEKGLPVNGCLSCHPLLLDSNHLMSCEECHHGEPTANSKDAAHTGLLAYPAHPDQMATVCGSCHGTIVQQLSGTAHLTVANEVNLVRQAFARTEQSSLTSEKSHPLVASLLDIPKSTPPESPLQLADDLLRRRCLRCHLYTTGDSYPATRHGTGCAACHLAFADNALVDHVFLALPTDQQCLSCHYGNRVGADYYGRFEHDVHWDFRTPFSVMETAEPYGVGILQLVADLHQQAGLSCIDCHGGAELMSGTSRITCQACHGATISREAPKALTEARGRRELTLAQTDKRLVVPVMKDKAHERFGDKVSCQVCHGQWSAADHGKHMLLAEEPDFEPWQALTRQGSAEVEFRLERLLFLNQEVKVSMADGITGRPRLGLWLQTYERRRWEEIETCFDDKGILQVCRPLLDLHLSYTNQQGELVLDGVIPDPGTPQMSPYTPHTTGRAGAFYSQRLAKLPKH